MSKYVRILAAFHNQAWALPEELLLSMQEMLSAQSSGTKWPDEEIQSRIESANASSGYQGREHLGFRYVALSPIAGSERRSGGRTAGKVAVLPLYGVVSQRASLVSEISGAGGGTSIEKLQTQFRQALSDPDCKAIVFDVDSPGGSVAGVPELAQEIYDARKQKPITAVCNSMACSAAYWLASAASDVVVTQSGQCGSIGVFMLHTDQSEGLKREGIKVSVIKAGKYKAEGGSWEPLSDDAREFCQGQVDSFYSMFVKAVAAQRGTSQGSVRDGYGEGRSRLAADAVKAGLADRIGTLDNVLSKLGVSRPGTPGAARDGRAFSSSETPDRDSMHCDMLRMQLEDLAAGLPGPGERQRQVKRDLDEMNEGLPPARK